MGGWDGQAIEDVAPVWSPRGMEVWVLVEAGWVAGIWAVVAGALKVCIVTLRAGERGGGGRVPVSAVNAILG